MAEVAKRAGLGKASVFHHFPTKAHLYCGVMARALGELEVTLLRALAEGGSPTERLEAWIDALIDALAAHPAYPGLLLRVLADDAELPSGVPDGSEAAQAVQRIATTALRLLREGMDAGEFERASATHLLQSLLGAIVHPLATGRFGEQLVGDDMLAPAQIERRKKTLRQLVRGGIVAHADPTPRTPRPRRAPSAHAASARKRR